MRSSGDAGRTRRGGAIGRWLVCALAVAAVIATACRSSPGGSKTPTPAGRTPVATSTAAPTPVVNGDVVTFPNKGYSVKTPQGWTLLPNASYDIANAQFPGDSFFAGRDVINGIQPNISITCLKPRAEQATTEAFRDGWQAFVENLTGQKLTAQPRSVGGAPAYELDYTQSQESGGPTTADRTDAVLVAGTCRWMFTLLSPPGKRADYLPALNAILDSFRSPL